MNPLTNHDKEPPYPSSGNDSDAEANSSSPTPKNDKINYKDVPLLPNLQFAVLALLCAGEKYGRELRQLMNDQERIRQSLPAFYQLMGRLQEGGFVTVETIEKKLLGQTTRERRYRITELGEVALQKTSRYYSAVPTSVILQPT